MKMLVSGMPCKERNAHLFREKPQISFCSFAVLLSIACTKLHCARPLFFLQFTKERHDGLLRDTTKKILFSGPCAS